MKLSNLNNKKKDLLISCLLLIVLLISFMLLLVIGLNVSNYDIKGKISKIEKANDIDISKSYFIEMSNTNNKIFISESGTYVFSGNCDDGNIVIDAKRQNVYLILKDLNLTSKSSSCILVENCNQVFINVYKNTVNTLSDSKNSETQFNANETLNSSKGCIYSHDNLTINGLGTLNINSNNSNGITCNDSLSIYSSTININSVSHGINVNDAFVTEDATITINSSDDGIHSKNNKKNLRNYLTIISGNIKINSTDNGLRASGRIGIIDGNIDIKANNNGIKSDQDVIIKNGKINVSAYNNGIDCADFVLYNGDVNLENKSLKSLVNASNYGLFFGGNINLNSYDNAIDCVELVKIKGSNINIDSINDGIKSDNKIIINKGNLNINNCNEGLEAPFITITGGNVLVISNNDGININCKPHLEEYIKDKEYSNDSGLLKITNGYIFINSIGDGIDSNDKILVTGGILIIQGPTNNDNSAIDFDTSFIIKGNALVIGCGSKDLATTPTKAKNAISYAFSKTYPKNTNILILDNDNNLVFAFNPLKSFSHIVINSNKLKLNKNYNIYINSNINGEIKNGLYNNPNIIELGTLIESFYMKSKNTIINN